MKKFICAIYFDKDAPDDADFTYETEAIDAEQAAEFAAKESDDSDSVQDESCVFVRNLATGEVSKWNVFRSWSVDYRGVREYS